MGSMMSGGGIGAAWILLWILLGIAVLAAGGVPVARAIASRREPRPLQIPPGDSRAVQQAKDALKLRYAHGEITREEYLQGKVELED
jgi:putative membrane protein